MTQKTFGLILILISVVSTGALAALRTTHTPQASQTFIGPTYTVPPGVILRVEKPFTITDSETPCDNWPDTPIAPTVLPCYIEIQAVATDNQGAKSWALQKWTLEAAPTPTPTPTPRPTPSPTPSPTPCPGKILPNGKCQKRN